MSSHQPEPALATVVGCIGSTTMRNDDMFRALLLLERGLCRSREARRAEMFARTLLTGLRDDGDDEDEVVKLDAEEARRQPELLDSDSSSVWRERVVGRMEGDLAVFCVGATVCRGVCSF
jgi:hypothetical protein